MYFRFFLLSSRAFMVYIGRSATDYHVFGFARYRPFFIKWRHRRWVDA